MKRVFQLVCLLLGWAGAYAQNLVPNANFETNSACPASAAQLSRCTGWTDYNAASADYFNACNTGTVGVPSNQFGNEMAASGNAYVGVQDYSITDFKEYLTTGISPTTAGATYEVSMFVSLADNAQYASNGLGVYFFKNAPAFVNSFTILPVVPQVSYKSYGPIANKSGWKKLTQRFTADSAYDHIVIGGFLNNSNVNSITLSSGTFAFSYYYIDSVVVKFADTISVDVTGNSFCVGDNIVVNYSVNNAVHFNTGNVFTVQLSNSVGSFASAQNIGSITSAMAGSVAATIPNGLLSGGGYRVRIVSSDPVYVSSDNGVDLGIGNGAPLPALHITSPVCEDDTVRLSVTSTTNMTNARWNGPGFVNTDAASITFFHAKVAHAGTYMVDAYNFGCKAATISGTLVVNSAPPKPLATSNSPVCSGDTLLLRGTTSGTNDTWVHNGNIYNMKDVGISSVTVADSGLYILSTWLNGCAAKDTVHVVVKPSPFPGLVASHPCVGDTLMLSSSFSSPVASYAWSGPNGFISHFPVNHIYNVPANALGVYHLFIEDTNGCQAQDSILVSVKPLPEHSIIGGARSYCEGESLALDAQNVMSAVSFTWKGPGGYISNGRSVDIAGVSKTQAGNYVVTTNLDGCLIEDSAAIAIKHTPATPDISANTPLFVGDNLEMKINNAETGVQYKWNGPDSYQAMGSSVVIDAVDIGKAGAYVVTADLAGCTSSAIQIITVDRPVDSSGLVVFPNLNNGDFIIKGTVKADQQVPIILFNDKGQMVYKLSSQTVNKTLYQPINLHGSLADGVYLLKLYISGQRSVISVVIRN